MVVLNVVSSNEIDKSKLWHSRLGYINKKRIAQLQKDRVLESFDFKSDDVCKSCLLGKMTKSPFTGTCERGEGLLDLVHTDVCGPFRSATKDGKCYYVTFTDDFSRYGYVYLIKRKSDTFKVFKKYQNKVENQLGRKIKLTPPRTPQLNGVAERRNRTLLDMVRSMMCRATLPISFWGYALETATHILNLVPTKKVSKTPFEIYPEESFRYLFYKPKDNVVFVTRRGVFLEREMICKEDSGSKIDLEEIQESVDEEPIDPHFYYGFHIKEDKISDNTLTELNEPANYKEAMAIPKAAKWKEGMKSEIQSMYDNQVWNLVDTTLSFKTVGCKWIFKNKTNMDGKAHNCKSRLAAKGYTQTHGIDSDETFSPVAKIKSIRIMLAIAAFHDYEIWQMDVKTAFLNGKLTEDVLLVAGISASMRKSHNLDFLEAKMSPVYMSKFLVYGGEKELRVTGYCDAGWQTDKDDSRSQSGWDIRSEDNPADPFTKALAKSKHDEHAKSIGLKDKIEF
ncbi:putative RNA-directed DNA polymerase [Tanacetum coccineum]